MRMNDGHDFGPRRKDRRVNEPLEIKARAPAAHRLAVEAELDDVIGTDQLRGERAGDQEPVRMVGMADADMAISIDDLLPGEDPVGDDKVLDQRIEIAHPAMLPQFASERNGTPP